MILPRFFRLFVFDRLDRYALRLVAGPFVGLLLTLLVAQLLERLLRLFDLAASVGAPVTNVAVMVINLVPHYLGLALPMAFTAAVFLAAARLSDDSELDVMLATGRSIARIGAPYFVLALLLVPFNLALFGNLQPMTRYGYRAAVYATLQTGWDAKVEENSFVDTGRGMTFSADAIAADGRRLRGVFVERRSPGVDEITTAVRGRFVPGAGGSGLLLNLEDGVILRERGADDASVSRFEQGVVNHDLAPAAEPFRDRGESVREQTLRELWHDMHQPTAGATQAAGEFHGRLARSLLPPLLPLLAFPLGMASKRGRRSPGIVFGALVLLALNHTLQVGESLAESGRLPALPALWVPFAAFGLLSAWIFRGSLAWPGDNPVTRAVLAIEAFFEGVRPGRRVRPAASAG